MSTTHPAGRNPLAAGAVGPRGGDPHYQPQLDGIRGLAILGVLLSHAAGELGVLPHRLPHPAWTPIVAFLCVPGWGGVDLFFTLSGFLITGILLRGRIADRYFSSFYARRFLRIFPIYYLFLILCLLAAHIWPVFGAGLPAGHMQRVSYFLYLQNWPVFWASAAGMTTMWGSYWSLAVEEQFYLIWPALIRRIDPKWMLRLCVASFLLGTPLRWLLMQHSGATVALLQYPVTRLDGLFLGAGIAFYRHVYGRLIPLAWARWAFATGAAMMLYIAAFHIRELVGLGTHNVTFGIAAYALMSAGILASSQHTLPWLHRVLILAPLRILGKYSYGIYVYHLLIFSGVEWLARRISPATGGEFTMLPALGFIALAILLAVAAAACSYELFEAPLLRLKRYFPSPGSH